ncbi:hypothetical protein H0N95_02355 [Candidatus Micrarchaeota archaeon]|nr:hypothetical protein [Candidatus Micrarchaeota archaeon]
MFKEMFKHYTHQGRMMVELGLFFVFFWAVVYIVMALFPIGVKLSSTSPFLAFGVLCVFIGLLQKKNTKAVKKASKIGAIEELGLVILGLELISAVLILAFVGGYAMTTANGFSFVASGAVSIILSLVVAYIYWCKHSGRACMVQPYDKLLLLIAIVSHSFWTSLLSSVV